MKHIMIPDTQIFPSSKTEHIVAAARYIKKHKPDKIIIIGDWWDMPSLSSYDTAGDKGWEHKDVKADIDIGWKMMKKFQLIQVLDVREKWQIKDTPVKIQWIDKVVLRDV